MNDTQPPILDTKSLAWCKLKPLRKTAARLKRLNHNLEYNAMSPQTKDPKDNNTPDNNNGVQALVDEGLKQHSRGNLAAAEKAYNSILEQTPHHPIALHYLGVIALQTNNTSQAVDLIQRASNILQNILRLTATSVMRTRLRESLKKLLTALRQHSLSAKIRDLQILRY
jgi:tetratricopeptide (TPR) repeat protein